ncbi:hypothetical protein GQ457_17G002100 [Hibiscus cannabinus]
MELRNTNDSALQLGSHPHHQTSGSERCIPLQNSVGLSIQVVAVAKNKQDSMSTDVELKPTDVSSIHDDVLKQCNQDSPYVRDKDVANCLHCPQERVQEACFLGGLWRGFVIGNKLNVGDRISMYKVHDSHYRVEVDKENPAATSQHGAPVACHRKVNNKRKRVLEAPDAPIKWELGPHADVATRSFFDQVIAKPSIKIFENGQVSNPAPTCDLPEAADNIPHVKGIFI